MSFKPRVYSVYRRVGPEFTKLVGTVSMSPDGTHGKLWLNMFDEEYQISEQGRKAPEGPKEEEG